MASISIKIGTHNLHMKRVIKLQYYKTVVLNTNSSTRLIFSSVCAVLGRPQKPRRWHSTLIKLFKHNQSIP